MRDLSFSKIPELYAHHWDIHVNENRIFQYAFYYDFDEINLRVESKHHCFKVCVCQLVH